MRLLALLSALCLVACAPAPRWYEAEQKPSPIQLEWHQDVHLLDPLTTDASTVDELHRDHKRAVCHLRPIESSDPDSHRATPDALLDRLKLCRDKGFDAVTLDPPNTELSRHAAELNLPVLPAPPATRSDAQNPASTAPPRPRP